MKYKISDNVAIRFAGKRDAKTILGFIIELAKYEKMQESVTATEADLVKTIFREKRAEVLLCEYHSEIVGFALFFHNYSTFLGKPGIYLEDLFIKPGFRSLGLGTAFFGVLARIAKKRGCGRIEWWCLDWNKKSVDFYLKIGAEPMSDWTVFRISEEKIEGLAGIGRPIV